MAVALEKVTECFKTWDKGGKGTMSNEDLSFLIRRLSPGTADHTIDRILGRLDPSRSGQVRYEEFLSFVWEDPPAEEEDRQAGGGILNGVPKGTVELGNALGALADRLDEIEKARARGIWQEALASARVKAAQTYPRDRVEKYFDEVHRRIAGKEYSAHIKTVYFQQVDTDKDGKVTFEEAASLIGKSLSCVADLGGSPTKPTVEEVRAAFDAHDTLVDGRGRLGVIEFLNLARYLQVRVAEAMLPLSHIVTDA